MKRRIQGPPKLYKHQNLMNEYNEMQKRIKVHLYLTDKSELKARLPKPTVEELDLLMYRIMDVLEQDSFGIKY